MKHLTLTLVALCIFAMASGQRLETLHSFEHTLTAATQVEANNALQAGIEARSTQRGGGNILFSEDFSNGFDGINGNGEWTTSDNANDSFMDLDVAPGNAGYYSNG